MSIGNQFHFKSYNLINLTNPYNTSFKKMKLTRPDPTTTQSSSKLWCFVFSIEMPIAEAKLCQKRSKTWSWICDSSPNCCSKKLQGEWEDAKHGACQWDFPGFAWFCYFPLPMLEIHLTTTPFATISIKQLLKVTMWVEWVLLNNKPYAFWSHVVIYSMLSL